MKDKLRKSTTLDCLIIILCAGIGVLVKKQVIQPSSIGEEVLSYGVAAVILAIGLLFVFWRGNLFSKRKTNAV